MKANIEEGFAGQQAIINRLKHDGFAPSEIISLLKNHSPLIRVNAFGSAARIAGLDNNLITALAEAVNEPINSVRLLGYPLSYLALGFLFKTQTQEAVKKAQSILDNWSELDKSDVIWYLESENIKYQESHS